MTQPRNARSKGGKRYYSWASENFWSVTTIIDGGIPKQRFLTPWGIRMVAEGAADLAEELPALVRKDRDAAISMLKGLPYAKRNRAADLGTTIHKAIEAFTLGKPMPPWSPQVKPFMKQFESFVERHEPVFEAAECEVYSRSQRYAGSLDSIFHWKDAPDERYVMDVKTGKSIYSEVALQLAAYRHAEFIGLPDGTESPMIETHGAYVLHLTDEKYRLLEVDTSDLVFKHFLFARETFRWSEETSKRVFLSEFDSSEEVAV